LGSLTKLENLEAYHTALAGTIPESIGNCSALRRIDIFGCELTGTIPESITALQSLQILHLKLNKLTGTIPERIGLMPKLSWVDLASNGLHGTVPQSLGSSTSIEDLRLGAGNKLYGPIPSGLCKNLKVNGGATERAGCDGILCPLGTFSNTGYAGESSGCEKCPAGSSTLYLGSTRSECQVFTEEMILSMFYGVMQGQHWPDEQQKNWGNLDVSVCEWGGLSCDEQGELESIAFPLVGIENY